MKVHQFFVAGSAIALLSGKAMGVAVLDISTFQNQIQSDSTLISGWITNQLKYAVPFNSTAGNVVPNQIKFLGFELGVEGVVTSTQLDVSGLRNLGTQVIDANKIDTFSRLPMPAIIGHAKIGLPFGWDAGVRIGGIPKETSTKDTTSVAVKNSIWGLDFRNKLIEEGALKPFGLTLGLNYTHANGSIDTTTPYNSQGQVTTNGTTYNSTLSANGTGHSTWDTSSIGAQVVLDKQILFFTPYVGASANKNFGSLSTALATTGTEKITNASNPADSASATINTNGVASDSPNSWDLRALAGFELNLFVPFLKLGLQGEFAGNKNYGGALGLRFQFH